MRFLLKFGLFLALIMVITSISLLVRDDISFPREPGPVLDNKVRGNYMEAIDEHHPQIVLLGDSTLGASLDAAKLAEGTDRSVYSISIPGSASALWYLILKNNIAEASYQPDYLVVVFRDTILTAPGYRVQGSYFELLDEYADHNEPLLMQNSFVGLMNPLEIMAEKYLPLYVARADLRKKIDTRVRYFTPALFGCHKNCTDLALGEIFAGADLEPGALVDAVGAAESYLYTADQLDFDTQLGRSYLPEMVRIANENNIKLVFVRVKVNTHAADPKLDAYISSLSEYLQNNQAFLLDYGQDARLTRDLFLDSIHLNPAGQIVFTQMVADGLNELFAKE